MLRIGCCLLAISISVTCCGEEIQRLPEVTSWVTDEMDSLREQYQWFHANPELSYYEKETSARIANLWQAAGFKVTQNVGGYGVVALLENGDGPTVMLRTDLDALPLKEKTPLGFASTVEAENEAGIKSFVMHACGHDVHMTNLVGVARYMAQHKDLWKGTLILIGQPAEERGGGAKAMLKDGLFERFPRPDYALAMHVSNDLPAGQVKLKTGYSQANVDSVDITVNGRGGHGSAPHTTVDPVVQAAALVMDLQTIVSREIKPLEPAVITVGSIHGGFKHNIIGDTCALQLTVRSYDQATRQHLLSAIRRKAKAIAISYNAPEPEITFSEGTPSLRNDDPLARRIRTVFEQVLGKSNVVESEPSMGGEDFSRYGKAGVPILMYGVGSVTQRRLDRFEQLGSQPPSLHSSLYYPDLEQTLQASIPAMASAAIELLQ